MAALVPHNKGPVRAIRNKDAIRPLQKTERGNDAVEGEVSSQSIGITLD
jgi:hypothetical protein